MRKRVIPEYEVGYKRPPVATQFKPGQSGNRAGRPKGSRNMATEFDLEMNRIVTITEHGRTKKVRKKAVIVKQVVNKAAGGDLKAASLLMAQDRNNEQAQGLAPAPPREFSADEKSVLDGAIERLRQLALQSPSLPSEATDTSTTIIRRRRGVFNQG